MGNDEDLRNIQKFKLLDLVVSEDKPWEKCDQIRSRQTGFLFLWAEWLCGSLKWNIQEQEQ